MAAIDGTWVNENGSLAVFQSDGSRLSGTYRTAKGRPQPTDTFDLVGLINGNLISFCVAWTNFDSMTAWVGRYDPESDTISTLWHLVRSSDMLRDENGNISTTAVPLWKAFSTQASLFTRFTEPMD